MSSRASMGDIARRAVLAASTAAAANVLIRQLGVALFGAPPDYEHLQWRDFLSTTATVVVAANVVVALCRRWAHRPRRTFVRIAVAVLVLSLAGPVSLLVDGVDAAAVAALALMHFATAAAVLTLLAPAVPEAASPRAGGNAG